MIDEKKTESAETQKAPPAKQKTPANDIEKSVSKDDKKPKSEAEIVWEGLSGKTQDRVIQLVRRAKKAEADLEKARFQPASTVTPPEPQPQPEAPSKEEVMEAVKKLREYGVVTQEDFRAAMDRMYLDREHDRLGGKYDGSDGRPKYISEEVEDYARTHFYGGNLEAAYKDMFEDELLDAEIKARGLKKKKTTYTEKPVVSVKIGEQPLTRESLRERLKQPDGADWWAKNREKIEPLLKKLSQA